MLGRWCGSLYAHAAVSAFTFSLTYTSAPVCILQIGAFFLFMWDTHKEALKRKTVTTYVSDKTIEKIIKLLRCAFKQAVRWEIIARNLFDNVILTKTEYAKRDIWTADG